MGVWHGESGWLVNGVAGEPGNCSRTGRDAPQIDPRRTELRTI